MALPPPLPARLDFLYGASLSFVLFFAGLDLRDKQFTAQIRRQAADDSVLRVFHTTTLYVGEDTLVIFYLTGDTKLGLQDGETRTIGNAAVFDIEQADSDGNLEGTIVGETQLYGKQDVTR